MRRLGVLFVSLAWLAALLIAPTAAPAAPRAATVAERLEVYVGDVPTALLGDIRALGVDREDLRLGKVAGSDPASGKTSVRLEAVLTPSQARTINRAGGDLRLKRIDGRTVTQRATKRSTAGYRVFKTYSGRGGIQGELRRAVRRHPDIAKLVPYGTTIQGQEIYAVKVTEDAREVPDGSRPSVMYLGAQHAREWITPEMVRRLMYKFMDGYDNGNRRITRLVRTTEMWFVPVANPDGYDYTFTDGNRLWRKNLRDNDTSGDLTTNDGVDLNRNYPTKWGYDDEGSSPDPSSNTYRGEAPASEPETQALIDLFDRVGFEFLVNYHSAAELLLYGTGWQVATPTPDDVIYEAMAGDDAEPAVEGYDPDISAELYTTNGDTDTHMTEEFGTLGFTPEMSTCQTVSLAHPDDEWDVLDCGTGFEFPDDPRLVREEFRKNVPFALSVAASTHDPDDPVSVVGRTAPDFQVDTFDVSYGDPQTVAVVAKRALRGLTLRFRVGDGPVQSAPAPEWQGGERYGDENDDYYAEYRGVVSGASEGDVVKAWFSARRPGEDGPERVQSKVFRYTVASDTGHDVLVLANEDYEGVDPAYPAGTDSPAYAEAHVSAVEAAGHTADVWDVSSQGVPHDLGVLSHYDAVVWYLGDNRLTADPEDLLTDTPFGPLPDLSVAERQQYLTLAVRDYLNEGGKLVHAGESTQHEGLPGISDFVGGLYYGLNGDPTAECVVGERPDGGLDGFFEDCLILADDFRQYWLGAYQRLSLGNPTGVEGALAPFLGFTGLLGGTPAASTNPLDEAGSFVATSDVLPVEEFPQFASEGSLLYQLSGGAYEPIEGERYAGALHEDATYTRLTRTVAVPAGAADASLDFALSYNVEPDYDFVFVEARRPGSEEWTTLPEAGGATGTGAPAECTDDGFLLDTHPFLTHYFTGPDCTDPGTTGEWHAFTGDSQGWQDVSFDLGDYAGGEVELSITSMTDPGTGIVGAFVDDTRIVVDGEVTSADGFEGDASDWTVTGPPAGSAPNVGSWQIAGPLVEVFAGTSTEDTELLGFGFEQMPEADRVALMRRALQGLIG